MKKLLLLMCCVLSTTVMAEDHNRSEQLYDYEDVEENEMENEQPVENFNQKPAPDTSKSKK